MKETIEIVCDAELVKELESLFKQYEITDQSTSSVKASGHLPQLAKQSFLLVAGAASKIAAMIRKLLSSNKDFTASLQWGSEFKDSFIVTRDSSTEQIEHIVSTKTAVRLTIKSTKED